jgi:hypothetical protein
MHAHLLTKNAYRRQSAPGKAAPKSILILVSFIGLAVSTASGGLAQALHCQPYWTAEYKCMMHCGPCPVNNQPQPAPPPGKAKSPDDSAIQSNLQDAEEKHSEESAAQINAVRVREKDPGRPEYIEALRQRFHVEAIQLDIPAACLAAGQLTSTAACDVIDAIGLGWDAGGQSAYIESLRILDKEAAKRVVFLSFPREMGVGSRVALVQKLYDAEVREFAALVSRIEFAMQNDQLTARLRTEYAIRDSASVAELRNRAADESRQSASAASLYIRNHGESKGVTFRCESACRGLIKLAQGVNVLDSPR